MLDCWKCFYQITCIVCMTGMTTDTNEQSKLKNITIRGIDVAVYDEFSKKMKIAEINMGDALNKMMTDVMNSFDDVFPNISAASLSGKIRKARLNITHHDTLHLSKDDFISSDKMVIFDHIDDLSFDETVDAETFEQYVHSINHCDKVSFHSKLPKLLILSKVHHSNRIQFYPYMEDE